MQYNYTTLLAALQNWPEDDDPDYVTELPNIMSHGQQRCADELGIGMFDVTKTATITSGDPLVTKPIGADAVMVAYDLSYSNGGTYRQLTQQQPSFVRAYNAGIANSLPRFYCEESETKWRLAPPPNFTGTLDLRGIVALPELSSGSPTDKTWMSTYCGELLLDFCLLVAEQYLKDDRRWGMVKTNIDLLLPETKAKVAQLRRVLPSDQLFNRMIVKPENADANPQNQ